MNQELRIDALLPPEMARRAEYIGVGKAEAPALRTFVLAVLAGAFIALGASRKVTTTGLLRNWAIVYAGNFVGAVGTAVLLFLSRQYTFGGGAIGSTALAIANGKVSLDWLQALMLGVLCNILVCLAVWLTFSARSTIDKIAAIIFPISAFVAAGFEHSVANMYFIPIGLLIKQFDTAFTAASGLDLTMLTWGRFLAGNLLPVTLGNIIGGSVFVAAVYWSVFLRQNNS